MKARRRLAPGNCESVRAPQPIQFRVRTSCAPIFGIGAQNEKLCYCVGAVKGGGKRLRSRLGSARTACS